MKRREERLCLGEDYLEAFVQDHDGFVKFLLSSELGLEGLDGYVDSGDGRRW